MKNVVIGREVLEVYDKYGHDFGLLDKRWASEKDRRRVTLQQTMLFSEYIEKLNLVKTDAVSAALKENALKRIDEIEGVMDPAVIEVLRTRVLGP
jgi:hypothetical protein